MPKGEEVLIEMGLFSKVVQHVFRDSGRDTGWWMIQKCQLQCDVIIEQPLKDTVFTGQAVCP